MRTALTPRTPAASMAPLPHPPAMSKTTVAPWLICRLATRSQMDGWTNHPEYPTDLVQRAKVDQWLDWKLSNIPEPMRPLFFRYFLKMGEFTDQQISAAEAECVKFFTILDQQLEKTGAYVAGSNLTIADCATGMAAHRWLNLPLERPELPNLARYYRTLSERPAFQKTILIGMP